MNKCSFYTLVRKNNKKAAELIINGYSDGCYYYYKKDTALWFAIHPLLGLSIAQGNTRKAAQEAANAAHVDAALKRLYNDKTRYKKMGDDFEKCIQELKNNNRV